MSRTYSALAKRVTTAAVLLAAFLAALAFLPPLWLVALFALIVAGASHEWARLCGLSSMVAAAYAVVIGVLSLFFYFVPVFYQQAVFAVAAAFWVLAVPAWLARGLSDAPRGLLVVAGAFVLLPAALALMVLPVRAILALLVFVWIADIAAYFVGSRFGRRKLAPAISPGKSWEGAFGGLAATLIYAGACAALLPELQGSVRGAGWVGYFAAAAGLCAASIVGDLFESAVKRRAGVKDSGSLLPGHGGILDRIDSATSTLPLAALLWPLLGGK